MTTRKHRPQRARPRQTGGAPSPNCQKITKECPIKFKAERADDLQLITGYGPGWLEVNKTRHTTSLLIGSSGLLQAWDCARFSDLNASTLQALAHQCPGVEVLLLGSGPRLQFCHPSWLQPFMQQRIGVETMDTPAALGTYNVLAMEGRKVLAALVLG